MLGTPQGHTLHEAGFLLSCHCSHRALLCRHKVLAVWLHYTACPFPQPQSGLTTMHPRSLPPLPLQTSLHGTIQHQHGRAGLFLPGEMLLSRWSTRLGVPVSVTGCMSLGKSLHLHASVSPLYSEDHLDLSYGGCQEASFINSHSSFRQRISKTFQRDPC